MTLASRAVALEAARSSLHLAPDDLWVDYVGLGGSLMPADLADFFSGDRVVDDHDYDVLVQTLNERFIDAGEDHVLSYSDEQSTS